MIRSVGLCLVACGVLAACADHEELHTLTGPSQDSEAVLPDQDGYRTSDDEWARIAQEEIPGFAGVYYDDSGDLVILLTDAAKGGTASDYLRQRLSPYGEAAGGGVRYEAVKYDFAQLQKWAGQMNDALQLPNVYSRDIDEVENRVVFGVRTAEAGGRVIQLALHNGVPEDAVTAEVVGQPRYFSLTGTTTTLMGGYQIDNVGVGRGPCTFGVNASFNGNPAFVTASHCTASIYSPPDGSAFYQPIDYAGVAIGTEVADITPFYCPLATCRNSDAAVIAHSSTSGRTIGQGQIARSYRPPWAGVAGVPTIVNTPSYQITQVPTTPVIVGMALDKVGIATGQTWGNVTKTCIDLHVTSSPSSPPVILRCQDGSRLGATYGDSGSPVFQRIGTGYDVALIGILWGGDGVDTWHSRISGIKSDMASLGTLTSFCVAGYAC